MEPFTDYLLQFGHLNANQIALIHNKLEKRSLHKNDYFSEAGNISREIAFVVEGVMRVCFYNNKGEEVTQHFIPANNFAIDLDSFQYRVFSMIYIQAVIDCEVIILNKENFDELSATIMNWDLMIQKIATKVLMDKTNMMKYMIGDDAQTKYQHFLEYYPNLANKVPLVQVASFLGITPSSLSRIRRNK
jgi:CRP-like cAMP-binding protein